MSPTILHELLAVKRQLVTRYETDEPGDSERGWDIAMLQYERVQLLQEAGIPRDQNPDAVRVLRGVLPYRRWCEESLREHEAQMAAGGREICPECGERSVKVRTVCTLGYAGHPGADYSALRECERETCDYADLA